MNDYALHLNEKIINDPKIVANCWADSKEKFFSCLQDESLDNDFYGEVNAVVNRIKLEEMLTNTDDILDTPKTIQEVDTVVNSLSNQKAPGFDEITYEHFKYGGSRLRVALVFIHSRIVT